MSSSNKESVELVSNIELAKNKKSCLKLLEEMEGISEKVYFAGWLMELEFILWQKVISIDSYVPLDEWDATIEAIKLLKKLSIEAGGWLYWSEEKGSSICFVPFKDWKTLYENHKILSKE